MAQRHFVGRFNAEQLQKGEHLAVLEAAQKETGLTYNETMHVKRKGVHYLEVYLIDNETFYNKKGF